MTVSSIKKILDFFVEPRHRNFELCFGRGKPRKMVAMYLRKSRTITIYKEHFQNPFDVVGAALHELAHHLTWEFDDVSFTSARSQGKRFPRHGKEFRKHLNRLTRDFNFCYREHAQGVLVYNPRKPTRSPRFVTYEAIRRYRDNIATVSVSLAKTKGGA